MRTRVPAQRWFAAASVLAILVLLTLVPAPRASAQAASARAHATVPALKWGPAPAVFRKGARMAVVSGDPMASGAFVLRLAMPSGYRIAPHFHPTDEHLRVVSGTLLVGMGDKVDLGKAKRLAAGDTGTAAAMMHHFAAVRGRTVVEVSGTGPFQLTYVNPADMPRP